MSKRIKPQFTMLQLIPSTRKDSIISPVHPRAPRDDAKIVDIPEMPSLKEYFKSTKFF